MMDAGNRESGIALLCDDRGLVLEIMHDGLGIAHTVTPGESWGQIVDEASVKKAHNFLTQLQSQRAAFDWELNVLISGEVSTLRFAGIALGDRLLIVAAGTNQDATRIVEEFVRINNEQTNALRAAIKENSELSRDRVERDGALYDELSRLNNQLVTLQRELAKKNVELEKLNDLKNRFLGMAAHDLRAPLGIIMAYSELILDDTPCALREDHATFLSIIRSSSEFMRQLVDDFLDVSIIESGNLRLDLEPVDLIALIDRNVAFTRVLAEKKQIKLSFQYNGPLPWMMLDPSKIEQVLNNLVSNAVKYSHPDGDVKIRVTRDEADDCAVISVQDQGQGIPADELDKLFQMFERTSVRSTGGEKSSGLGLAIARRIVEGHRGRIWVESQVGQGTMFYVSLPIDQVPESRQEAKHE